jgi:hypothetical protein
LLTIIIDLAPLSFGLAVPEVFKRDFDAAALATADDLGFKFFGGFFAADLLTILLWVLVVFGALDVTPDLPAFTPVALGGERRTADRDTLAAPFFDPVALLDLRRVFSATARAWKRHALYSGYWGRHKKYVLPNGEHGSRPLVGYTRINLPRFNAKIKDLRRLKRVNRGPDAFFDAVG